MTMKRLTTLVMLLVAIAAGAMADTYQLWVGETQVTDDNKDDILGDGTMTYTPATNTMTLDGTSITCHATAEYAICNYGEFGELPAQLDLQGGNITIESDPARGYAINSPTKSPFYLFHEKGTLSLLGGVLDLYQMNLINNTEIVSPEGAYYDAEKGSIYNSRGNVEMQEWIVISNNTTPTDINKPSTPITHHPSAVYDLQGRLVASRSEERGARSENCKTAPTGNANNLMDGSEGNLAPRSSLPTPRIKKGLYIINGKKYINYSSFAS